MKIFKILLSALLLSTLVGCTDEYSPLNGEYTNSNITLTYIPTSTKYLYWYGEYEPNKDIKCKITGNGKNKTLTLTCPDNCPIPGTFKGKIEANHTINGNIEWKDEKPEEIYYADFEGDYRATLTWDTEFVDGYPENVEKIEIRLWYYCDDTREDGLVTILEFTKD